MSFLASAISSAIERTEWPTFSFRSHSRWRIGFGRALLLGGRRLGGQEHEVEVAERRHLAAAGAAEADQRDAPSIGCVEHALGDEIVGEADELVVEEGGRLGRRPAAAGLVGQPPRDLRAARRRAPRAGSSATSAVSCLPPGKRGEPLGDRPPVDDRAAILDVEQAHGSRSAASRFSR